MATACIASSRRQSKCGTPATFGHYCRYHFNQRRQAKYPQNQPKPVDAGLCIYKNCRQEAQMLSDYCGKHDHPFKGLAEEIAGPYTKRSFMKKFDGFVGWLRGDR